MRRRIPGLLVVVAALAAIIVSARDTRATDVTTFSVSAQGWMPSAASNPGLTETWFCPGVPAPGTEDRHGEVVIANRSDSRIEGTVLLVNDARENARLDLTVEAWSSQVVDLDATLPGAMVGAVVEVEGGGALVEQVALAPNGNSSAPCATATSDVWHLADGFTVDGSTDKVILTNPFDQTVVADLRFSTTEGSRSPARYSGITVAPRSVRVVDLGAPGAGAQSEPVLAVTVETSQGRLVVGRAQTFLGGGRLGGQVTLAQPALGSQWWFAGGQVGAGVTEQYAIYNPTDDDVEVDVVLLGIATAVDVEPIEVPRRSVATFDPSTVEGLGDGSYSIVFFATQGEPAVVVDRVTTQTIGDTVATTVIAGATGRPGDGWVASTWHVVRAPADPTADAIAIHNVDNSDGTVSVYVVGASGPTVVPNLQDLVLPAAQQLSVDLTDPAVAGRQLIVETSNRVLVETAFPTGRDDTRAFAWAIPQG